MDDLDDAVDELLDDRAAADILQVTPNRLDVMVSDGMLAPTAEAPRSFADPTCWPFARVAGRARGAVPTI